MTKILIIIALLVIAIIIIFFFDRKNITEHFTEQIIQPDTTTTSSTTTDPTTTTTSSTTIDPTTTTTSSTTTDPTTTTTSSTTTDPTTTTAPIPPTTPTTTAPIPPSTTTTPTIPPPPNYNQLRQDTYNWVNTNPITSTIPETPTTSTAPTATPEPISQSIANILQSANIENPQIMNPVGQQIVSNTAVNQISIIDFLSVVLTYVPWGIYYAGNILNDNILVDLLNRPERNAIITGNITKNISNGNGAIGNIKSISGTINTTIEWPTNSIPEKFTICSITRYNGNTNNKRILTARDATPTNDWIHGHKSGQKGIVYYNNEYKTKFSPNMQLTGELTDWVITCAKNDGTPPNNIYINGSPSGINSGGNGKLRLSINKIDNSNIINEMSDFGLSYIIIWDTCLSDNALKIVSDSLVKYLQTGEDLLFDIATLTDNDKFKVLNAKGTFLINEINETNARLLNIANTRSLVSSINTVDNTNTTNTTDTTNTDNNSSINMLMQRIIALSANTESKIEGTKSKEISLNPNTPKIAVNNVCSKYTYMPEPDTKSFTEPKDNIPITSDDISYQSYIWCKCNGDDGINNNTEKCKTFNICRDNYAENKNYTYDNISDINKKIYDDCKTVYSNFPKYLEINSLK